MEKHMEVEGMATAREPLPPADRESLLDAFHAVRDALLSNDTESLGELYDEDFRAHSVRGEVEGRGAVLEAFRPGGIRLEMFEIEDLEVEMIGEVGILTGLGLVSGRSDNTEFRHRVRFVDVFLRRDGRWRYHFSQSTEIVPELSSPDEG
jgi:ketosteroid isomerase-like protein